MRRRYAIYLIGFVVLTMGSLFVLWYATQPAAHRINQGTVEQIKEGMTLAEVEAIFGMPAGDYSTRPILLFHPGNHQFLLNKFWTSDESSIGVFFDDDQHVRYWQINTVHFLEETWLDRLRRWLRLR